MISDGQVRMKASRLTEHLLQVEYPWNQLKAEVLETLDAGRILSDKPVLLSTVKQDSTRIASPRAIDNTWHR